MHCDEACLHLLTNFHQLFHQPINFLSNSLLPVQLADELDKTQTILSDLEVLKDELYPVAQRGTLLYAIMRSLSSIKHEYQFTLSFFLQLFDEAAGGQLPAEFGRDGNEEEVK